MRQTCLNVPVYTLFVYVCTVQTSLMYSRYTCLSDICESGLCLKPDFVYSAVHLYLTVFVWQTQCVGPKPVCCTLYTPEYRSAPVFSTPVSSQIIQPCNCAPHSGGLMGPSRTMRRMEWGCLLWPPCCFRSLQTLMSCDHL